MEKDGVNRNCAHCPGHKSCDCGILLQHSENEVPAVRPTTLFLPTAHQGDFSSSRRSSSCSTLDDTSRILTVANWFKAHKLRVVRANSEPLMMLPCLPAVAGPHPANCLLSPLPQAAGTQDLQCMQSMSAGLPTNSGPGQRTSLSTEDLRPLPCITTASLTPITPTQPATLTSLLPGPAVVTPTSNGTLTAPKNSLALSQQIPSSGDPFASMNNHTSVVSSLDKFLARQSILCNQSGPIYPASPLVSQGSVGLSPSIISCPSSALTPVTPTTDTTVLSSQDYQNRVSSQSLNSNCEYVLQPDGTIIEINKVIFSQMNGILLKKQQSSSQPLPDNNDSFQVTSSRNNTSLHIETADNSTPSQSNTGADYLMHVGSQGSTSKCLEWLKISRAATLPLNSMTPVMSDIRAASRGASAFQPSVAQAPTGNLVLPSHGPSLPSDASSTQCDNNATRNHISAVIQKTFTKLNQFNAPALAEPAPLCQLRSNSFPVFNGSRSSVVSTSYELQLTPSVSSLDGDRARYWSNFLQTDLTPIENLEKNSSQATEGTSDIHVGISEPSNVGIGHAPFLSSVPENVPLPALSPKTCILGVDLRLTMPCSPPVPESGDETAFSFQDCETATLHDSDLDSIDSDSSADGLRKVTSPHRCTNRARCGTGCSEGPRGAAAADGTTTPPEHFVFGGVLTDGDFDAASSVVLEEEPIFDEYEPVSDQDETAVVELSDSDIDTGFAVTAAALAAAEADSQLSDEFADQSAMESDDCVDTDELDMAGFLIAFRKKEKRRQRDGSGQRFPSEGLEEEGMAMGHREASQSRFSSACSDSDHDLLDADRWRCLECNQLNKKSFFRYCEKCWKMRRGWLPDPPKKRRKRKPRNRPHRRRTTSTKASDTPTPDKDVSRDACCSAGTSGQPGGEISKSCSITVSNGGASTSNKEAPAGAVGTSRPSGELSTSGVDRTDRSISPKVPASAVVAKGDVDGSEPTCFDIDDLSVVKGANSLPSTSFGDINVVVDACSSKKLCVSGKETTSVEPPESIVKVTTKDDFINYYSNINCFGRLSYTFPSKAEFGTGAVNRKAEQVSTCTASACSVKVDHLKMSSDSSLNSSALHLEENSKEPQSSLKLDLAGSSFGEDAIDGNPSKSTENNLCSFARKVRDFDHFEESYQPQNHVSLNKSSSSLDSSFERVRERSHLQSVVQGVSEPASTTASQVQPVLAQSPLNKGQFTSKQPTLACFERHSIKYATASESVFDGCNMNLAACSAASQNNTGLYMADGKSLRDAGNDGCSRRTPKRSLSTASTVSLNNSFLSNHNSDCSSAEEAVTAPVDADHVSQVTLTSILEHNTLMSIKQHVDGIDAPPQQIPLSSVAVAECSGLLEHKSSSEDQHNGAELDRFSTHSATDSVPSAVDSGLGSSQELFQDSPLESLKAEQNGDAFPTHHQPDKLEMDTFQSRRKNKTSIYSKKVSYRKGEKSARKHSNGNDTVVEIVDVYIEDISSDSNVSSKPSERGAKRKLTRESPSKKSTSNKKARKDNTPLKRYLTNGLLLNSDEVDVKSLSPTHSTRIISTAIAEFLRSKDSHSWLATDVGRSWVSSASVQAMLLASIIGNGVKAGGAAEEGSSTAVDVRTENLCIMCQDRPKDAAIIHGKTSHQTTCYKCAKTLFARKQRCPVCRRKILRISKNIIV